MSNDVDKLSEGYELEGGISHDIEEIEELRLLLNKFLKPEILDILLNLKKELDKEPRQPEMYSWFVRNSQLGGECKYAQQALKAFKEKRLIPLETHLIKALAAIQNLKQS